MDNTFKITFVVYKKELSYTKISYNRDDQMVTERVDDNLSCSVAGFQDAMDTLFRYIVKW